MLDPDWTVLVPVEIIEGETVPEAVIELLSTLPVVVLGYHVLPEQTPPGQARMQFEEQAQTKLDDLAVAFREAGGDAETRLVFTHDEEQTLNRVADETGCSAILIPNPASAVERVLVPVRGEVDVARIVTFVTAMVGDRDIEITLFDVTARDGGGDKGNSVTEAREYLRSHGITVDVIERDGSVTNTPVQAIATAAVDHDVIVMGESAPSLRTFLFGETTEKVAARSLGPVIAVRRERDRETAENTD
ncbi:universal stress protein [Haladaptatus sp. NG-WS-4]